VPGRVQVDALEIEVARSRVVLLQPDTGSKQMEGRRLRLWVGDGTCPLERATSELENIVVPAVPKRNTREAGQRVALTACIIRLARHPERLFVSRSRSRLIA
jgi:hypothetical protein